MKLRKVLCADGKQRDQMHACYADGHWEWVTVARKDDPAWRIVRKGGDQYRLAYTDGDGRATDPQPPYAETVNGRGLPGVVRVIETDSAPTT